MHALKNNFTILKIMLDKRSPKSDNYCMIDDAINKLRKARARGTTLNELSGRLDIGYGVLWRLLNVPGHSPTYRTLKKIVDMPLCKLLNGKKHAK